MLEACFITQNKITYVVLSETFPDFWEELSKMDRALFSRLRRSLIMICAFELFNFILIIPLYAQSFGVEAGAPTPQGVMITDAIIHLVPTRISMKGMWFESMAPQILEKHLLPL